MGEADPRAPGWAAQRVEVVLGRGAQPGLLRFRSMLFSHLLWPRSSVWDALSP